MNKQKMWQMMEHYRGRYAYMLDSDHIEDRSNAFAMKLATQAWQDLAHKTFSRKDDGSLEYPDFNPESVIADIQARWDAYTKTGVPEKSDSQAMADAYNRQHALKMASPVQEPILAVSGPPPVPASPVTDIVPEFDPKTGQRRRKKAVEPVEQPAVSVKVETVTDQKPAEINQLFIDNIRDRYIHDVIMIIRSELGLNVDMVI